MLSWLLGLNLKAIEITLGAAFISVMAVLIFIAVKVEEIEKEDRK